MSANLTSLRLNLGVDPDDWSIGQLDGWLSSWLVGAELRELRVLSTALHDDIYAMGRNTRFTSCFLSRHEELERLEFDGPLARCLVADGWGASLRGLRVLRLLGAHLVDDDALQRFVGELPRLEHLTLHAGRLRGPGLLGLSPRATP